MGELAFFAWRRVLNDFLRFGDGMLVWDMVNGRKRGFDPGIDQRVWDRCGFHPECTGYARTYGNIFGRRCLASCRLQGEPPRSLLFGDEREF
jgi:hypothetical protein